MCPEPGDAEWADVLDVLGRQGRQNGLGLQFRYLLPRGADARGRPSTSGKYKQ